MGILSTAIALFGNGGMGQKKRLKERSSADKAGTKSTVLVFGQSLVEYALILSLIALMSILVLKGMGRKVNNTLSSVNSNMP